MKMMGKANILQGCLLLVVILISGCQAVFTSSPFKAFVTPKADEIPEERLAEYCWDILAGGTDEEKAAAYAAVKAALEGENASDPDLNYVAGTMALDQAGFNLENLLPLMENPTGFGDLLSSLDNNEILIDTGQFLPAAYEGGANLTGPDLVLGGLCGLLNAEGTTEDILNNVDFNNPDPEHEVAVEMINEGAESFLALFGSETVTNAQELVSLFLTI